MNNANPLITVHEMAAILGIPESDVESWIKETDLEDKKAGIYPLFPDVLLILTKGRAFYTPDPVIVFLVRRPLYLSMLKKGAGPRSVLASFAALWELRAIRKLLKEAADAQ